MTCPICKSSNYFEPFYKGVSTWEYPGQFNFIHCRGCNLVLQFPRVSANQVSQYYNPQTYWGRVDNAWKEYSPLYKTIFRLKHRGSILDVGSGLGLFLSEFRRRGWQTLGTEISSKMAQFANHTYGIRVLVADLINLKLSRSSFDVVTLNNVLEHLYQPRQTLLKVHRLLKTNGLLVLVVPNINSLGHLVFRSRWYHLQPGRHVYHFSPMSITKLLALTGFRVIKINHTYWRHNYYSWFCSLRFNYSPRFTSGNPNVMSQPSFRLNLGKIAAIALAAFGATLGQILGRGEVITIYARKT